MKRIKLFNDFIAENELNEINKVPLDYLKGTSYTNLKMGSVPGTDKVNKALLDDIETAAREAKVHVMVTAADTDHPSHSDYSRHNQGLAVDLARIGDESVPFASLEGSNGADRNNKNPNPKFVEAGNRLVDALVSMGYSLMTEDPDLIKKYPNNIIKGESGSSRTIIWRYDDSKMGKQNEAGNHYNHIHASCSSEYASNIKPVVNTTPNANTKDERAKLSNLLNATSQGVYVNRLTGETGPANMLSKFGETLIDKLTATLHGSDS